MSSCGMIREPLKHPADGHCDGGRIDLRAVHRLVGDTFEQPHAVGGRAHFVGGRDDELELTGGQ